MTLTDAVAVFSVVFASLFARFGVHDAEIPILGVPADYWALALVISTAWLVFLAAYRTRDSRVVGVGTSEYKRVVGATAMLFGLLAIVFFVAKIDIARGFFVVAFPIGLVAIVLSRWFWRQWLTAQRRSGRYLSNALVVGKRADVDYVTRQITRVGGASFNVVGVALNRVSSSTISVGDMQIPVVGDMTAVAESAVAIGADTVIVAGQPRGGGQFIRNLGWDLERTDAELVLASRLTNVAGPRIHFRPVEGLPLMHVELPHYEGGKHVLKRALDVVASGFALILLSPLFAVIAMMIRRDSDGPALFRQERVGRNGKTFQILKFRSMVETAEEDLVTLVGQNEGNGVLFKMRNDPRVTTVGRILRKYSLDELPQLWNVFVGDMSLVGPRPPLPREVADYEHHVNRRLYIKPGLTGMWQVSGRSNLSWEESVRLDLYYVENWSLTGDLVIMWRTIKVLINPVGAY